MKKVQKIKILPVLFLAGFLLAGCNSPEEKEAAYLKRGNELFDQGDYDKARVEYKNAARIKPADAEVAYRFGLVNEATGDFRGAFNDYTRAEQQNAHFAPALLKLAEYYLAAERYDEVQKRIDIVLSDKPDEASAHAMKAALLLRQKDFPATEKEARLALAKDPANVAAFSVLTGLYMVQGDKVKALQTVEDGIARNPKSLPLMLLRSNIHERSSDLAKTADAYEAIFKIAPKNTRYRLDLANIYLKAGKLDEAESVLRAGVAAQPDDWSMKYQLVTFLGDHRGLDAAEKELRAYMQAYPDNSDLYTWLTDLYVSHDAADRAVTFLNQTIADHQFDRQGLDARTALARLDYIKGDKDATSSLTSLVLEHDPNNLDARFMKARLEYDNGFYQNAVADLRAVVRDKPKAKQALMLLAETFLIQGHPDLAIDTIHQAVDADPLDLAAKVRLAQMYHLNGDSRHAMDILFLVTKENPKYAVGWETTARVAIDTKDWTTADSAIQTLDALDGQHPTATFLRGEFLTRSGKADEAIPHYKAVIEADPSTPLAERALTALVETWHSENKIDEATNYIESLKSKNPAFSTILGESYLISGKTEQAAANLDTAIGANTNRPEPYLDRARMFVNDHKPDQALATLKKAAAVAPADLRASLMEAQILGDTGQYREAIALYNDLLVRNPDLDGVANNLAEIIADYEYADPAALEKARHVAERFAAASNPLFLDTLAWVYYRQGNIDQARAIMDRAMAMSGKLPPQVHYHYGAMLLKSSRSKDAKAELEKATVDGANYPGLDDARTMLKGL